MQHRLIVIYADGTLMSDNMKNNNCYFIVYEETPGIRKMGALCEECMKLHLDVDGWFWNGSRGYKPDNRITCRECGFLIHEIEKEEKKCN